MLFVLFALSAQDLCKRCLQYNASSASAHETLGAILERECAYKDAAECYEKAWRFTHQGSAATGYLLAFNYLKVRAGLPADPSKVRVPQQMSSAVCMHVRALYHSRATSKVRQQKILHCP